MTSEKQWGIAFGYTACHSDFREPTPAEIKYLIRKLGEAVRSKGMTLTGTAYAKPLGAENRNN